MDMIIKFTERSTNPNNYAILHANLKTPFTQYSTLIIDSLTTNCCFEVLNKDDYITFNETKQENKKEETNEEEEEMFKEEEEDIIKEEEEEENQVNNEEQNNEQVNNEEQVNSQEEEQNDEVNEEETKEEEEEEPIIKTFTIKIAESYSSLNAETVSTMLNDLLNVAGSRIRTIVDNTNRIVFQNQAPFSILAASYRMKDILGIFDQTLPLDADEIEETKTNEETKDNQETQTNEEETNDEETNQETQTNEETETNIEKSYSLQCLSVGNFLSTAILYLVASIGDKVFVNNESGRTNRKILMRINNSYSANFPVISNNAEFSVYCLSNDFSDITFELVDARFNPIKLLSPMYLTGTITGDIKSETIKLNPYIPELLDKNNNVESVENV